MSLRTGCLLILCLAFLAVFGQAVAQQRAPEKRPPQVEKLPVPDTKEKQPAAEKPSDKKLEVMPEAVGVRGPEQRPPEVKE